MPPQILAKVKSGATYTFRTATFESRPMIAQGIADCLNQWSRVETLMGLLFLALLKANYESGASLWNEFSSSTAKTSAIKTVAHAHFQADDKKIFDAVWKQVNSLQATRDRIAHWLWGDTDDFADGMVIVDPKQALLKSGEIFEAIARDATKPEAEYASDTVYLYRACDLTRDLDNFERAQNWIFLLAALATGDSPKPDEIRTLLATDAHLGIS